MKVLLIADPHLPVPPDGYGGTERVVHALDEALNAQGHQTVLLAKRSSKTKGKLLSHRAPNNASHSSRAFRKLLFQPLSLWAARGCDVVHNFGRVDYLRALMTAGPPLVHTFANPVAHYELSILKEARVPSRWVSISQAQRRDLGSDSQDARWRTVYNAVRFEHLSFHATPNAPPYVAFLGRLTKNKGVDVAIRVARAAGIPLKIAGNVSSEPGGVEFFEHHVKPALGDGVEWVGEIGDAQKSEFLGGAIATLFPIQWDEPFGMVVVESLACGTPVIAARRASTPELLSHGETGFLCDNDADFINALGKVSALLRARCREACVSRFSAEVMARRYLEVYTELLGGRG